ncbi:uncharacterized protein LOC112904669 [Agrilus planipennis]|uniref:Uncharacterized protein LOC112904669 n=1 Tax=Agrilus planipennis TaxID=224129 RepID=A0A7F5R523_AGRPL|nr:uncharacterized protein LOC112904669 [Agrilus planipennis]
MRRLDRSYFDDQIISTDSEAINSIRRKERQVLDPAGIQSEMHRISSMASISTDEDQLQTTSKKKTAKSSSHTTLLPIKEGETTIDLQSFKAVLEDALQNQTAIIKNVIASHTKSIQYDLKKKLDEIKNSLVVNNMSTQPCHNVTKIKQSLGVVLPLENNEEFVKLDVSLKKNPSTKESLMALYRVIAFGEKDVKGCIGKIMAATLSKNVQLMYSGTGKTVHGVGKLNFRNTNVFLCLKGTSYMLLYIIN